MSRSGFSWGAPRNSLGFTGYAPGFIDDWWVARVRTGAIELKDTTNALSRKAGEAIARRLLEG